MRVTTAQLASKLIDVFQGRPEQRPGLPKFTAGLRKFFVLPVPVKLIPLDETVERFLIDLALFDLYLLLAHFAALTGDEAGPQQKQQSSDKSGENSDHCGGHSVSISSGSGGIVNPVEFTGSSQPEMTITSSEYPR